jgi:hypothetical protein
MKVDVDQPKRQLIRANETGSRVVFSRAVVHTRQIAVSIMVGAEAPINEHLIKPFLFTFS